MACTDPLRRSILDSNSKGPALTGGGISAVIAKSPEFKIFSRVLNFVAIFLLFGIFENALN